jgi:hypothetical protein
LRIQIFILIFVIALTLQPTQAVAQPSDTQLSRLENFLMAQFDPTVGLVRESPDETVNRTYWLLSDNLIAAHVLKENHPDVADRINATLNKYGIFTDGLHEALFGGVIQLPLYTPIVKIVENESYVVKVEKRSNQTGKLQNDWTQYADLLLYAALSKYNQRHVTEAIYYFSRARDFWNEAGLRDKPTELDGFYTTHKLALLMYTADLLNQTPPFRDILEQRIWMFQREDGGIRSHYSGNLTSHREANSETAGLVLLAYQNAERIAKIREAQIESVRMLEQALIIAAITGAAITISLVWLLQRKPRRLSR